jgi:hypothetical protein
MAYISSLHELTQPPTQGALYFSSGHIGENISANSSVLFTSGVLLGNERLFPLRTHYLPTKAIKATSDSAIALCEPQMGDNSSLTWAANTSLALLGKGSIGIGVGDLRNWQSRSIVWERCYRLSLDLQRQIVEESITHVHSSLFTNWRKLSGLTGLFQEIFEMKGVLEETNRLVAGSSLTEIPTIEKMYVFRRSAEILQFLEENLFLIPLLKEAYIRIGSYFPSSKVSLEVVADQEMTDEKQLVIFISVDSDSEQATERLDRLDEEWWLDALEKTQGKLCITLEF